LGCDSQFEIKAGGHSTLSKSVKTKYGIPFAALFSPGIILNLVGYNAKKLVMVKRAGGAGGAGEAGEDENK
jgi:hypothetical protein